MHLLFDSVIVTNPIQTLKPPGPNTTTITPIALMSRLQRTTFAFNKVLADFIVSAKTQSPDLKNILRKHYRVIDNTCMDELKRWDACLDESTRTSIVTCSDPKDLYTAIGSLEVFRDCTLATLSTLLPETYHATLFTNLYTLTLITLVFRDSVSLEDGDDDDRVLEKVLGAVAVSQSSSADDATMAEILDDDYRAIIQHICDLSTSSSSCAPVDDADKDVNDIDLAKIMDSKIGKLAAEISKDIDPSSLDMANPMDMLNMSKLADGTSPLGEIISKVGGTIQGKLASGELNQGELIAEAVNMLKMFDKNNALGNMFSQATKSSAQHPQQPSLADFASMFSSMNMSPNQPQQRQNSLARDRLRAKLTSKQIKE